MATQASNPTQDRYRARLVENVELYRGRVRAARDYLYEVQRPGSEPDFDAIDRADDRLMHCIDMLDIAKDALDAYDRRA